MNSKVAFLINQHINHPKVMEALTAYVDERIELLRMELERCKDDRRVHELQGAITAIREIYKIREYAIAVSERG